MGKQKSTKHALRMSVLSLVLCFAMLLGTTFAWFTASVSSSGNIIKSGILNIDLGIKAKGDTDYVSVKTDPSKKAFNYELWEPGYTEVVNAKVSTTGNLSLKYSMRIIANGTASDLANVIDVYYADEAKDVSAVTGVSRDEMLTNAGLTKIGTLSDLLAGTRTIEGILIPIPKTGDTANTEDEATIALHMQESAGNEYQDLSIGTDFSIQILATQYTYEEDSFDDQYDANAQLIDLPKASISVMPNPPATLTTTFGPIETVPVDQALVFSTADTTVDIAGKDYEHWDVDFEVKFNQDVDGRKVYLFGQYDTFSPDWQGAVLRSPSEIVPAGTPTRLIRDWLVQAIPGVTVDYTDVVILQTFNAALHVEDPATGLVATVDLVMTDPATGNKHVISTITKSY